MLKPRPYTLTDDTEPPIPTTNGLESPSIRTSGSLGPSGAVRPFSYAEAAGLPSTSAFPNNSATTLQGYGMAHEQHPPQAALSGLPVSKVKLNYIPMVSSKRCVCIAECKWEDDDDDAFYQAAAYACQEAFANMTNLHFVAIYVLVLAKTKWTYGILRPQGWVEVVNGRINKDNIERFHQQQQQQVPEFLCFPVPTLETRLEEATQYYREYYSRSPKANYPNDRYLVGTLHICQKWFKLPVFDGENKMDVARFYEGLLKIVVGKRVITKMFMELRSSGKGC